VLRVSKERERGCGVGEWYDCLLLSAQGLIKG
jgi:hypothetical protein